MCNLFYIYTMKGFQIIFTMLLLTIGITAFADAGFSIRRRTAPAKMTFEGVQNLAGYTLQVVEYSYAGKDSLLKNPFISHRDTITDSYLIYIQNGGKRWDESERYVHFALTNADTTGAVTDTFTVYMKEWNYVMQIKGVTNGKLQYTLKKSKAYYPFSVFSEGEADEHSVKLNRWIYIICSVAGLSLLILLFLKRNKVS